eukprot:2768773-Prymnesium_polylepis.2
MEGTREGEHGREGEHEREGERESTLCPILAKPTPSRAQRCMYMWHRARSARPGCVLLSADYCQIELRMVAHLSADDGLLEAFSNANNDIFVGMASRLFRLPPSRVDEAARDRAKVRRGGSAAATACGDSSGVWQWQHAF